MDVLAIKNILDYFKNKTVENEYDSEFVKAGRKFYTMVTTTNPPKEKIVTEYTELMKIPLSYCDMRSIFG